MKIPDPNFFAKNGKSWVDWATELKKKLEAPDVNTATILQSFPSTGLPSAEQSGILIFEPDANAVVVSYGGTWNTIGAGGPGGNTYNISYQALFEDAAFEPLIIPGPAGNDGAVGVAGAAGAQGADGADGLEGERGFPGKDGIDGAPGILGPQGFDGLDGIDGFPGATGANGVDGVTLQYQIIEEVIAEPLYIPGRQGDTGPGGITKGTATLDFGAFPGASDTSVTVTGQTGIGSGAAVQVWLAPAATADHTADEHIVETLNVFSGNVIAGAGFTIYGVNSSRTNEPLNLYPRDIVRAGGVGGVGTRLYGKWNIGWSWSN
jgi:hypothetical protein